MLGLGLRPDSMRMGRKKQLAHGSLVCLCCLLICEGDVDQVAMRIFCLKVLWVSGKPACRVTEHFVEGTGVHMALCCLCSWSCRCPGLSAPLRTSQGELTF